jgi:hypothetical protein
MKDEHVYYARANYIKSDKESKRMSKKVLWTYFKNANLSNSLKVLITTPKEEEREIDPRRDGRISSSNPEIGTDQKAYSL